MENKNFDSNEFAIILHFRGSSFKLRLSIQFDLPISNFCPSRVNYSPNSSLPWDISNIMYSFLSQPMLGMAKLHGSSWILQHYKSLSIHCDLPVNQVVYVDRDTYRDVFYLNPSVRTGHWSPMRWVTVTRRLLSCRSALHINVNRCLHLWWNGISNYFDFHVADARTPCLQGCLGLLTSFPALWPVWNSQNWPISNPGITLKTATLQLRRLNPSCEGVW